MKKLFLTSAITLCTICPAMAEHQTVSTFPADEYMLEDYTYQNQATYTNMGVYEGSVSANAYYDDNQYTVTAGHYLPASSEDSATTCLAGSYCPGLQSQVYYSEDSAQGITACPNGFGNSAAGSTADTDCYRTCDIANMGDNGTIATIAHAATLTGNDYYGNGTDTCEPASCVSGYHVKAATPDLTTVIGTDAGTASGYVQNDGTTRGKATQYGLTSSDKNAFVVDYGSNKGVLRGRGRCSTRDVAFAYYSNTPTYQFSNEHFVSYLTDETGQEGARYCYCHLDSYTPVNSSAITLSGPWVFRGNNFANGDASDCSSFCSNQCASSLKNTINASDRAFRAAMFGAYPASPASCAANTITITWADVDPTTAGQNNEGTATYGSDINTPFKAATKPGKTFRGWKFVKPANNNNG